MKVADDCVVRADLYLVGPPVPRVRLAGDMGEVFESNVILRLTTESGLEGLAGATCYTEHGFDHSVAEAVRCLLPEIIGQSDLARGAVMRRLHARYNSISPQAQSLYDIALWDLAAKRARMPLYQMLGGARRRIPSYASTPLLDSPRAYVDFVAELRALGFSTVKFHTWCEPAKDRALLEAVHEAYRGSGMRFMVDLEQRYARDDALRIARQLEDMDCVWLEAPLPDTDFDGYRALRERTSVPVIPAGNTLKAPAELARAAAAGVWDALRVDVTNVGGISVGCQVMQLAAACHLPCELQSWGYTLTQAANLQVMLAYDACRYFEQAVPYELHEAGTLNPIRTTADGHVEAPPGDGLGVDIDWPAVDAHCLMHVIQTEGQQRRTGR